MQFRKKVDKILRFSFTIVMITMVINIFWQIFTRFFLKDPSIFNDELARFLMIWASVLGVAYVSGKEMDIVIELLPNRLSKEKQKKLKRFINFLIVIICFAILVVWGLWLVYNNFILHKYSTTLKIPLALVYVIIPLGGFFIIYYKVSDIINNKTFFKEKVE